MRKAQSTGLGMQTSRATTMSKLWSTVPTKTLKFVKPIVHVGFVPLIIYIAMKQEPDLTYVPLVPLSPPLAITD